MTIALLPTIPTGYQRQDTRTNAADSFANCNDLQTALLNHNILLAERCRRGIYSQRMTDGSNAADAPLIVRSIMPVSESLGAPIWRANIAVSQWTRSIKFVVRAKQETALKTVYLWPNVYHLSTQRELDSTYKLTVNTTSEAKYSVSVNLPPPIDPNNKWLQWYTCSLHAECSMATVDTTPASTVIDDMGIDSYQTAAAAGADYTGYAAYFTTDATIEPRIITRVQHGQRRHWVWPKWNKIPSEDDTLALRQVHGVYLYSVDLYEDRLTSYTATYGTP